MIALIDADILAHAAGFAETEEDALLKCDRKMQDIILETTSETYRAFLSGTTNFRKEIDPEYKANRDKLVKPQWLSSCREFLVREWKAEVMDDIEADDGMGIAQDKEDYTTIICSVDKDMRQVPGFHYQWAMAGPNWSKPAQTFIVGKDEALKTFYAQSLIGDTVDNIIGVWQIGPVKAKNALITCENEQEMFDLCRQMYSNDERYLKNLKLLWIMQKEDDIYNPYERGLLEYGN